MEKILFACDELTGLIGAAARMRPSKSVMDMELSSLKKKFKDKRFAAGCSREVIKEGAERLGWTLDELLEKTILAMRSCEESILSYEERGPGDGAVGGCMKTRPGFDRPFSEAYRHHRRPGGPAEPAVKCRRGI